MTITITLALIAAIFPLFIYADYKKKYLADNNPDIDFDYNDRSVTFILSFTPFAALFYADHFWLSLLYMVPLYAYFGSIMYVATKKSWCKFMTHDMYLYPSSGLIVTIICYFIWFHGGILSPDDTNTINGNTVSAAKEISSPSVWPYYIFGALAASILITILYVRLKLDSKSSTAANLLLPTAIIFPLLPLFIDSYWWGMLATFVSVLIMMPLATDQLPVSSRGGIGFVVGYIYMMAATLSILLYAILF